MRLITPCSILGWMLALQLLPVAPLTQAQNPTPAPAQNPGLRRTILQREDLSVPGRETVIVRVEMDPGVSAGRHTHPGEEIAYVLEGTAEVSVEGQPARTVNAGETFVIPSGTKHDARNIGTTPLKLVSVYVVEKGKPLSTPAP